MLLSEFPEHAYDTSIEHAIIGVSLRGTLLFRSNMGQNVLDDKKAHPRVEKALSREVDTAVQLLAGTCTTLHPDEAHRIMCAEFSPKFVEHIAD
jgi:hypothetical protein